MEGGIEMEVNLTNYCITNQSGALKGDLDQTKPVDTKIFNKIDERIIEESRKSMMSFEDMQKFLYMLIGSEIRVEPDRNSIGVRVNKTV